MDDCFMTDDSYMTAAVFMALLFRNEELGLIDLFLHNMIVSVFIAPDAGWGLRFLSWIRDVMKENDITDRGHIPAKIKFTPNDSAGNGSAMRVSPIAYMSNSLEECKELTREITSVTNNHPCGDRGWIVSQEVKTIHF